MIFTNLLTNMVVLTLHNTIPTNTPAFQEYAFREMFSQASNMIVSWNLDLPRPITTNMVTDFHAAADSLGPEGIIVFSNRFVFSWLYSLAYGKIRKGEGVVAQNSGAASGSAPLQVNLDRIYAR